MFQDSYVHRAMIVSGSDKGKYFIKNFLMDSHYTFQMEMFSDSHEARRELINSNYDLVLINTPLIDEVGYNLAKHITEESKSLVIFIVKQEQYDEACINLLKYGVLVVPKPINKQMLYQMLINAIMIQNRRKECEKEIIKLKGKLEELRYISKAKCLLIEKEKMSEDEAHRYIEKMAMDTRDKKITIALDIIRKYPY